MPKIEKETWGSHVPLNLALIETYDIPGVLELGAGDFSTKLFFERTEKCISIETDMEWIKHLRSHIKEDENHKIMYHDITDEMNTSYKNKNQRSINSYEVSKEFLEKSREYTEKYAVEDDIEMMFVDSIRCLRNYLLNNLYQHFEFVTFHDYTEKGKRNHYGGGFVPGKGWRMFVDKTYDVYTGLIMREEHYDKVSLLRTNLEKQIRRYTNSIIKGNLVELQF